MCVSDARCQMPATERGWGATTSGLRRLSALLPKDTAITRDIALAACAPAGFQFPATGDSRRPGDTGFSDSALPVGTAAAPTLPALLALLALPARPTRPALPALPTVPTRLCQPDSAGCLLMGKEISAAAIRLGRR